MGSTGRKRLGTGEEFVGSLDSQVPHPTFNDADAETNNEFIERLEDNGTHTGLAVIAPHGGDIEPHTDQQAEHVASRLAAKAISLWRCKGFKGEDAFACWHVTSTDVHEASFPLLNSVISRGFIIPQPNKRIGADRKKRRILFPPAAIDMLRQPWSD
jgi:hypothetical protein